jgi:hypothetical protein
MAWGADSGKPAVGVVSLIAKVSKAHIGRIKRGG